jgi:hypothetical protein
MNTWHYELNGVSHGPIAEDQLKQLVSSGVLSLATLVWQPGAPNWMPFAQAIPALAATAPPPPLPNASAPPLPGATTPVVKARKKYLWLKIFVLLLVLTLLTGVGILGYDAYKSSKADDELRLVESRNGWSSSSIPREVDGYTLLSITDVGMGSSKQSSLVLLRYSKLWDMGRFTSKQVDFRVSIVQHQSESDATTYVNLESGSQINRNTGEYTERSFSSGSLDSLSWASGTRSFQTRLSGNSPLNDIRLRALTNTFRRLSKN